MAQARRMMVEKEIVGAGVKDQRVVDTMLATPRHEFVPLAQRKFAYFDMALPIGGKQTISSPFIVAYMTESIDPQPTDKVLEIGTGSGYQAAVLSPLVRHVYTIEIVPELGRKATVTLKRLRYDNVKVKVGDGFKGWPEHAPFDKIILPCSPEKVPQPLVDQLAEGGLMVIPVGRRYQQTLYLFRKKNGELVSEALRPTLFVPMTGAAEDRRAVKPDPANPSIVNGDFEREPGENRQIPGWYYQRQMRWDADDDAPQGEHVVTFTNDDPGRGSRALQGLPVDGQQIKRLRLAAWIRLKDVAQGPDRDMLPAVAVSFYDENRRDVGRSWLGPWVGTAPWRQVSKDIPVPIRARHAILRIGLFGATGEISLDDVQVKPIPR